MFCSECGKQVADDAKFCGECGAVQADTAAEQFTNHHQRPTSLSESNVDDKSYTSSSLAKSDVVIITTVVAIFALFLYSIKHSKPDEWYVGHCAAGVLSVTPTLLTEEQIQASISWSSQAKGLNSRQVLDGYRAFKKGDDYSASCAKARELEQSTQ